MFGPAQGDSGGGSGSVSWPLTPPNGTSQPQITDPADGDDLVIDAENGGDLVLTTTGGGDLAITATGSGDLTLSATGSGSVRITNNAANDNAALTVTKSPSGSQNGSGIDVVMGSNAAGSGVSVTAAGGGAAVNGADTSAGGASGVAGTSQRGRGGYFSRSFSSAFPVVQLVMAADIGGYGLHVAGGSQNANAPVFAATQTWTAVGATYKGIFLDVTNTASAAASRLLDLQVGSTSLFSVCVGGQFNSGYSGPSDGSSIVDLSALTSGSLRYNLSLFDKSASFAQGTGSGIAFGSRTNGTDIAQAGGIYSSKTNGTSGNHAADIGIATNNNGSILEAVRWTSAQHTLIPSGSVYGVSSSSTNAAAADTAWSRVAAGVWGAGNGTPADVSATVRAAILSGGNGTAGAPSHTFTANTDRGIYNDTANSGIGFTVGGSQRATMTAGVFQLFGLNLNVGGTVSAFNGTNTFGMGVPAIHSTAAITAQTSNANICSLSVPGAGDYEVSATLNVTAATSLSTSIECTYTDTASNARTLVLPLQIAGGTGGTYLANGLATATGDYTTPVQMIRVAAGSTITLRTASGTFTSVTYSASGSIKRTR